MVGLAENKANSAPIEIKLELELSLAICYLEIRLFIQKSSVKIYLRIL